LKKEIPLNIFIESEQTFYYQISLSLSSEYYQNEEGILLVSGKPSIYSEQLDYEIRKYNYTHELYYFYPYKKLINLEVFPSKEDGEITIKGIKPTIVKDFKQVFNYDVPKGIGPQYFRIIIDKGIKDGFTFNFGTRVNWFEGTMFDKDLKLNTGKVISSFDISSNDAGKTYTAVYNNTGKFIAKKKINWE
jgi:hypothetical protein